MRDELRLLLLLFCLGTTPLYVGCMTEKVDSNTAPLSPNQRLKANWGKRWLSNPSQSNVLGEDGSSIIFANPGNTDYISFCQEIPDLPIYQGNLIKNPDFRNGTQNWNVFGSCILSTQSVADIGFGIAAQRGQTYSSISQRIYISQPGWYEYIAWVKLGNGSNQFVQAIASTWKKNFICVASALAKSECWTKIVGGFTIEQDNVGGNISLYFECPSTDTDLYLASVSVTFVNPSSWRKSQNDRIDKLRKRDVNIRIKKPNQSSIGPYATVRITQLESSFPFGSSINGGILVDKNFQKWIKSRFNWAVFENEVKWYYTEPRQNSFNYADADRMLNWCLDNNITVRGHNIFWEVASSVQKWVKALDDVQLQAAMQRRLTDVVSRYKGKFAHWDVNNEMLHGHYFSDRLGPSIRPWMFQATQQIDPDVKLFVNDYNVVEECGDTVAMPETYLRQIWDLQLAGAKVDSIGVESHFAKPQAVRLKHDLDQLAVAGLPVWITELDVREPDLRKQADYFEMVMREAFSHPVVQGIILWETISKNCTNWSYGSNPQICSSSYVCDQCLVDSRWKDRPIGKRYLQLRNEWSTNIKTSVKLNKATRFRVFFGKYKVKVAMHGWTVERFFDVPPGSLPLNITLTI